MSRILGANSATILADFTNERMKLILLCRVLGSSFLGKGLKVVVRQTICLIMLWVIVEKQELSPSRQDALARCFAKLSEGLKSRWPELIRHSSD